MIFEVGSPRELAATDLTFEGFVRRVHYFVAFQPGWSRKSFSADAAHKGLLFGVNSLVISEMLSPCETLPTHVTMKRFINQMTLSVLVKIFSGCKSESTQMAYKRLLACVCSHVVLKAAVYHKLHTALLTLERLVLSVQTLVST